MQIRQKAIIASVLGLVIISALLFRLLKDDSVEVVVKESRGVEGEALDVALDFAQVWLDTRNSTTTDPYKEGLVNSESLSVEVSQKLVEAESNFRDNNFDPVLCQTGLPSGFKAKPIFENESEVQAIIFPKEKDTGVQTIFTLKSHDNLWEITDISCGTGEQGPELGEFTFEQEGFLLKQSVPPPLDSNHWHLVFEQNGVLGHTAPLFLGEDSKCLTTSDNEETCNDSLLAEAMRVVVKGSLTEAGVEVKRVELVE
ncbi:MAG: hypothetical protein R3B53_03210 [Candidatus Paceibacterota bacterium]